MRPPAFPTSDEPERPDGSSQAPTEVDFPHLSAAVQDGRSSGVVSRRALYALAV